MEQTWSSTLKTNKNNKKTVLDKNNKKTVLDSA